MDISNSFQFFFSHAKTEQRSKNLTEFKEVDTSSNAGQAHSTSFFGQSFGPQAAFKGDDDDDAASYWSSDEYPRKLVQFWFRFKTPQQITKIAFEGKGSGQKYEVIKKAFCKQDFCHSYSSI